MAVLQKVLISIGLAKKILVDGGLAKSTDDSGFSDS